MSETTGKTKTVFSDNEGNLSSMRIMAFMSLVIAGVYVLLPMIGLGKCEVDPTIVLWFLTGAFAGKAFQKYAERK